MIGPIPTSRSCSGWLDRLRTSKGLPVPSDLDLEHFLHSNLDPSPNPTPFDDVGPDPSILPGYQRKQQQQSHNMRLGCEKEQCLFDLMSNVLSELFVMGNPQESAAVRKGSRKQLNPRACVSSFSASADVGDSRQAPAMSPSSADNSVAEEKRDHKKIKRLRVNTVQVEGSDSLVNIGTVVTVIDTSSPGWKTEKHFRKGMTWKGREKKVWNVCKKKRKLGLVDKLIVEREKLRPLAELKEREHDRNVKLHNEEYTSNIIGDSAKKSDYHIQIPTRPKFLRSPRLPVKNSSLFRLQVITKNIKSGLSGLDGSHKGKS